MTLDPPLAHTLALLDEALCTIGPYRLGDEQVFVLDKTVGQSYYQRFVLAHPRPTQLQVWFEVSLSGVSFYLDRSAEIPEWAYTWIQENPEAFQAEIMLLFSSHILVEHKGTRTVLRLFGNEGKQLRQFTFTRGLSLNLFRKRHFALYKPLFPAGANV